MKKLFLLYLFITYALSVASAQESNKRAPVDTLKISKNLIKFNITSVLIKNYSLQYERILTRGISVGVAFRMMPESGLPFKGYITSRADITDPKALNIIDNTNLGNFAITPEIRFYTGKKKYGNGFYFALFYRYGRYTLSHSPVTYETDAGDDVILNTSGKVSSNTVGFKLGAQWSLGKHICLDWWMFGPHFGVSSGDINSLSSAPLAEIDQQDIANKLNDINIPMFKQNVNVTADRVSMNFKGPWAGISAGLSLGVKF